MSLNTKSLMDNLEAALKPLGLHVKSFQVNMSPYSPAYEVAIEAVYVNQPATRAVPKAPVCECGAAKTGGMHSSWCPLTGAPKP